jgi:uncharacterized membrane protein
MALLILGLAIFFGAHLLPSFPEAHARLRARLGAGPYRGLFSLVSLLGFALIVWGYAIARPNSPTLWQPPVWSAWIPIVLMIPAMILLAAAYVPAGRIKAAVRHPMLAAVKIWAFAHLLANGDLAGVLLFGSFLAYAVWDRISVKRRGAIEPVAGPGRNDAFAVFAGLAFYAAFLLGLHRLLIGVPIHPV